MGTSHRHKLGVEGQPNWGNVSSSVTAISSGVKESNELNSNPPPSKTPGQIIRRQSILDKSIRRNYHHAVRNYVRAAGGRSVVSHGHSYSIGRAGVAFFNAAVGAFHEISEQGLSSWLSQRGVSSLEGKSCKDVLNYIKDYLNFGVTGLDETAAKDAMGYVWDVIDKKVGDDISEFDKALNELMSGNDIKDLMDEFFGYYIFSHLSQDFAEKLESEQGTINMQATLDEIRDLIIEDVKFGKLQRPVESIDWNSPNSEEYIKKEFNRILFIFCGNED